MKKSLYLLAILVVTLTIYSCGSSINVLNNWTGDNLATVKDANILVVTRAGNPKIRKAFEDEMTKQLKAKGLKATPSYIKHPNMKPDQKLTKEREAEVKAMIEKEGYTSIVFSVLKDEITNAKSTETGGYEAGQSLRSYYPPYIPVYTYGFYGAYYSPYSFATSYWYNPKTYDSYGTYVEKEVETQTSKSFVLETMIYNLELAEDKQLLALVTTKIDEPDNFHTAASGYAKKVVESFEKK